ncbi:retrovirus-related pol polyprotein from transposon TNT 1-94 [Tanacetum coccineum]|uniref:Retrovirus-related pol polyprotein from transposon TNT 1-94 n=1 Tax=Tanacetum coccineum TaxID=301880 RepID=A0ABQ5EXD3_9ASTR
MVNESSAFLWHKHSGHISKERLQRLVKNKILPNPDFTDFGLCVECIKAKQTKHNKKGATRSDDLLEIIHTDICGPFDTSSFTREKYLITFIDDFSRYGYVYLLHEKSQSINALEVFINEVERQLDRKVKIVRSDRGCEYYENSRIVEKGNAKFLENGKVSRSVENQVMDINELRDDDPSPMDVHKSTTTPDVVPTKGYLSKNFEMKDMGEASYVIGISIFRDVSKGLGVIDTISKPLKIYCNNTVTNFFYENNKYCKGAKHIDIKFFIVKEEIQKQRVYLEHISTDLMIADPLTNGLPPKEFTQHFPSQPPLGNSGPQSSTGDCRRQGDCEKMRVLALELIFSLPSKFSSLLGVPTNFNNGNPFSL